MSMSKRAMFDEIEQAEEEAYARAGDRQVGGDHYKRMAIEPWEIISGWPIEQQVGMYRGNALKYLLRAGTKGDALVDLEKAQHYLERLLEVMNEYVEAGDA